LICPNPLNPAKYVVLNTGLTIEDRGLNGDCAIVKAKPSAAVPVMLTVGLFDAPFKHSPHWIQIHSLSGRVVA